MKLFLLFSAHFLLVFSAPKRAEREVLNWVCGEPKSPPDTHIFALYNFECVVECATGRIALTDYDCYGCWCGFGGCGTPVDEIDRCCMHHDNCYDQAIKSGHCGTITQYTAGYDWKCVAKSTTDKTGIPTCEETKSECGKAVCACDTEAALCFAKYKYPAKKPSCPHKCPWPATLCQL